MGSTGRMRANVAPPTPPICQDWMPPAMSLRGSTTAITRDEKATEVAAPASASLSGVAPPRPSEPMTWTKTAVSPAPSTAAPI